MELYVHLPFCRQKCRYCDFVSFPGMEGQMEAYVSALLREAELVREDVSLPIRTVYCGGGTPSLLPPALLGRLLRGLKARLPMAAVEEWTVEANPGTLTPAFLEAAAAGGVNRLSLGMQAAQDGLLEMLGRIHRFQDVRESVSLARRAGFRNLSLDLMFGLPGQTADDWRETLEAALSLRPEHISAYGLIPEEGTPLFRALTSGRLRLPEPETEREMYDLLLRKMAEAGFVQYEISNFSKPGFACAHNLGYWTQVPYLGLGVSAASMISMRRGPEGLSYLRRTNTRRMEEYLAGIRAGKPALSETEIVTPPEARFETMMLFLRMNRGIREADFSALHGRSLASCYGAKLRSLQDRGLIECAEGAWKMTRLGMDLQNTALVELMDD